MATKKSASIAKSTKKEDPPTRVFVGNPDLYPVPTKFATPQNVNVMSLPPLGVTTVTPFAVGERYNVKMINIGDISSYPQGIHIDAIVGNWIQIRRLNVPGNPYGAKFWLNFGWVVTAEKIGVGKSPSPKSKEKKS